jgi:hypothetical protein
VREAFPLVLAALAMSLAVPALAAPPEAFFSTDWLPVTDAERQMSAPVVEKGAGVEALFWRTWVDDNLSGDGVRFERLTHYYVRLKVFSEDGKRKAASLDILYGAHTLVTNITGRTIRSDGSILELSQDAIHEREVVRANGVKVKAMRFSMPGVEVGSIIEYRWAETQAGVNLYMELDTLHEFPAQKVIYHIKPLPRNRTTLHQDLWHFNCQPTPLELEPDGVHYTTMIENVPADHYEPMMPGERLVRPWLLLFYYRPGEERSEPAKYWPQVARNTWKSSKSDLKTSDDIRQAAAHAVEGAGSENEKALALVRYIRANVRNVTERTVSEAERLEFYKNRKHAQPWTSADTFKARMGTPADLNELFAALGESVGLQVRPALISRRDEIAFDEKLADAYFVRNEIVAVLIGGKWKMYDISQRLLPPGMLIWQEEGARALLPGPDKYEFIPAPSSSPEDTLSRRTANLRLSADGTLEGDLEVILTGHRAHERRLRLDGDSQTRRQEWLTDEVRRVWAQSEVTGAAVENAEDPEKPLRLRYHIRLPGYAARTGKRILFQPLFFERGTPPLFAAVERRYDVSFPYAWQETDRVSIELPEGFELEKAESPGRFDFGAPGSYQVVVSVTGKREIVSTRDLVFGKDGTLVFALPLYPRVKKVFDEIYRRDNFTLSLKQAAAPGGVQ